MVTCSACGRTIEKVPVWMTGVQVEFICTNCPQRQTKNIAFVNFELEGKPAIVEAEVEAIEEPEAEAEAEV